MLIQEKIGTLTSFKTEGRAIDWLQIEWFETGKRILHGCTASGKDVALKFLSVAPNLRQGDVLYADEDTIIAVSILPCEAIIIEAKTMYEMAAVCYEIGNKHLPLFYDDQTLLIPYDAPVFRMLQAAGFDVKQEWKTLLHPLKTSVAPHGHSGNESLFSKILKLTTPDAR